MLFGVLLIYAMGSVCVSRLSPQTVTANLFLWNEVSFCVLALSIWDPGTPGLNSSLSLVLTPLEPRVILTLILASVPVRSQLQCFVNLFINPVTVYDLSISPSNNLPLYSLWYSEWMENAIFWLQASSTMFHSSCLKLWLGFSEFFKLLIKHLTRRLRGKCNKAQSS